MKKKILITASSMCVGGIERSLVELLNAFDYERYDVELLLFSREGEFLPEITDKCVVLPEIKQCADLLKPIKRNILSGHFIMALSRLYSKLYMALKYKDHGEDNDALVFASLQTMWNNAIDFMPRLTKKYDVAISFMWPHHFVAKNVNAVKKFAWIHTDYTKAILDRDADAEIWESFDKLAAVSDECGKSFCEVYPSLSKKVVTIENILSPETVRKKAAEFVPDDMPDEGKIKLLTVGRFCFAKAFDRAVDVCRLLIGRGVKIKWYAVGYGTLETELRNKISSENLQNDFIILGKKSNPYPYMKACDIYVQPSRYEGKAVTVREAQILGKPVVITNFRTAKSQVRDGFDAVIADMSAESIADKIQELISDENKRKAVSENAYNSAENTDRQMKRVYDLLEGRI
ncbi:MAG: glycosyltransferase [Clostridiales bacterium]|nr:glycosyltransferase [Clostridiales bacterium]